ncbi:hypothetical protein ABZY44_33200 [Streptomyces sp. NPDC006544]|uniref:hypothetical protein n=1 Tax=Streptomyces sp. NPDC006544 TaxID=3154583 RepID=UPI0033A43C60
MRTRQKRSAIRSNRGSRSWAASPAQATWIFKTVTLFAGPGRLGCTEVDGPHAIGTPVHLPAPFDLDLDTSGL